MTLEECRTHIGEDVVYTTRAGEQTYGVITDVGRTLAIVRYRGDLHSKGTHPEQLTLLELDVEEGA